MTKLNQEIMSIESGAVIYYTRKGTKEIYELDNSNGDLIETIYFNIPINTLEDFEYALEVYDKSLTNNLILNPAKMSNTK